MGRIRAFRYSEYGKPFHENNIRLRSNRINDRNVLSRSILHKTSTIRSNVLRAHANFPYVLYVFGSYGTYVRYSDKSIQMRIVQNLYEPIVFEDVFSSTGISYLFDMGGVSLNIVSSEDVDFAASGVLLPSPFVNPMDGC